MKKDGHSPLQPAHLKMSEEGNWQAILDTEIACYYRGDPVDLDDIRSWSMLTGSDLLEKVTSWLEHQNSCFCLAIESHDWVLGLVDHARSIPLFFSTESRNVCVTDYPRSLLDGSTSHTFDQSSVSEFLLSGYVHGENTLIKELKQLKPGTFLVIDKDSGDKTTHDYFEYFPKPETLIPDEELISSLQSTMDSVFQDIVASMAGRQILVPLSGGLDSRLVLAKLIEHGCKDLLAFSYGVPKNQEIATARKVSEYLGVEWCDLSSAVGRCKELFDSDDRRRYSDYADGLHVVPGVLEYEAISRLREPKLDSERPIVINGLSGDFLFGGHVGMELVQNATRAKLIEVLLKKHCDHVRSWRLQAYSQNIKERLFLELDKRAIHDGDVEALCAFQEHWDWRERQAKAVLSAQRLYEWANMDWYLPLWDKRVLNFCSGVPLRGRFQQTLHQAYLSSGAWSRLFAIPRVKTNLWQGGWRMIPGIAHVLGLVLGRRFKNNFYRRFFYYGYYRHQLSLFGRIAFLKISKIARAPYVVPVASISRLDELGCDTRDHLD